jgi:hypothetical protein
LAKKRRQKAEKKDDPDFNFPEFDEQQFISLELRKVKVSLVAFILAVIIVIVTFQLYTLTYPDARVPMVVGIFGVIAVPYITKYAKIDTGDFDWKNWLGPGAVYIMSWLALFILVINPPFSDFVGPIIVEDELEVTYLNDLNGTWIAWDTDPVTPQIRSPVKINITVEVIDNSGVDKDSVKVSLVSLKGDQDFSIKMVSRKEHQFRAIITNDNQLIPGGEYSLRIEAKDIYGKERIFEKEIFISN